MSSSPYRHILPKMLAAFGRPASIKELANKIGCPYRSLIRPMQDLIFAGEARRAGDGLYEVCSPKFYRASYKGVPVVRVEILHRFKDEESFTISDIVERVGCSRQNANGAMRSLLAYKQAAFVRAEKNSQGKSIHVYTIKHRERVWAIQGEAPAIAATSAMDRFWHKEKAL